LVAFESFKKKIGYLYILKKFKDQQREVLSFKDFFNHANDLLIILPDTETEFRNSLDVVYALAEAKKNIKLFIRDYRVSLVARKNTVSYFDYNFKDFTKLYLPTKTLLDNIYDKKFDIVIDCNLFEDVFTSAVVASINSKYKIGFKKGKTDRFFNVLLVNNENNPAFSYRNLLNSLQMF
jgi:hypothetical protein